MSIFKEKLKFKLKSFSLMEILVSLMITALIIVSFAPAVIRRTSATRIMKTNSNSGEITSYSTDCDSDGCALCTDDECLACQDGYNMYADAEVCCPEGYEYNETQSACIMVCSTGYYGTTTGCEECPEGCSQCTDSSTCTSCKSEYRIESYKCVKCPTGCSVCYSNGYCSDCISGYRKYNSLDIYPATYQCFKCQRGYYCTSPNSSPSSCPSGKTSNPGATSSKDCYAESNGVACSSTILSSCHEFSMDASSCSTADKCKEACTEICTSKDEFVDTWDQTTNTCTCGTYIESQMYTYIPLATNLSATGIETGSYSQAKCSLIPEPCKSVCISKGYNTGRSKYSSFYGLAGTTFWGAHCGTTNISQCYCQ